MRKVSLFFAATLAVGGIGPSVAQDTSANPLYGEVSLAAGFMPDPHKVQLQSGGSLEASDLGGSCSGYIADAPDYRLRYDAGSSPLIISVESGSDTTLIINAPDGSYYCDDDSGNGTNPSVRFAKPASGRYEIWIGTYASSSPQSAELNISELSSK